MFCKQNHRAKVKTSQQGLNNANLKKLNIDFYKNYFCIADIFLFKDEIEELVFVDFVNKDRKIVNFIAANDKVGFFNYDRFLNTVEVGDVLKVRFQNGIKEGFVQGLFRCKTCRPKI